MAIQLGSRVQTKEKKRLGWVRGFQQIHAVVEFDTHPDGKKNTTGRLTAINPLRLIEVSGRDSPEEPKSDQIRGRRKRPLEQRRKPEKNRDAKTGRPVAGEQRVTIESPAAELRRLGFRKSELTALKKAELETVGAVLQFRESGVLSDLKGISAKNVDRLAELNGILDAIGA